MQYYGARELAESFRTVRRNTIQAAQDIPENKYGFKATPDTRSVAETLVHIAVTPRLQHQVHAVEQRSSLDGFDLPAFFERLRAEERESRSKAKILELLQEEGDLWANWVRGLSEGFLAEEVETPMAQPARRNRFE